MVSEKGNFESLADDIMYQISNGQNITLKHCSLGLGIHSATGTKDPIVVLSRLGHSITYEKFQKLKPPRQKLHVSSIPIPVYFQFNLQMSLYK